MKIQPGTIVAIKWLDSRPRAGWVKQGTDVPLGNIISAGFVVAVDKRKITLSTSMQSDNTFSLDPVSIPRVAVVYIIELGGQRGIFKRVSGNEGRKRRTKTRARTRRGQQRNRARGTK